MELITAIDHIAPAHRGASAALGNFDGLHPGHQTVIDRAGTEAKRLGAHHAVISFEPHPRQFFRPQDPPFRLTSLHNKARLLSARGVAVLFALRFDRALADMAAEDFAANVLGSTLGLTHVVVGADFRFGKKRGGDVELLAAIGKAKGYAVSVIDIVGAANTDQAYSSTDIRAAIRDGNVRRAGELLHRPWSVDGEVAEGDKRGRQIGFPTLNLTLGDYLRPKHGVYAVEVEIMEGAAARRFDGVANVGVRPTFGGGDVVLEAHLFDFAEDIYGCQVFVHFVDFLREERTFEGIDALKAQIAQDCIDARSVLAAAR